ncbi:MAG: hypothetical protein PVSMB4_20030 [Ktedonobacterales bacterium]
MLVSLWGAVPSQSVLTLAADEVAVLQTGLGGFFALACESVPSLLSVIACVSRPLKCWCVTAGGSG